VPANPKTEEFLAHSSVPVMFTDEDIKQVVSGNYLVKVIYLPDPRNQGLAFTGPNEINSTQLEPGADPIEEARRRGSILLVIRMGNMDQQAPNTPPISATPPAMGAMPQQGMMPQMEMAPNNMMAPYPGLQGQQSVPPLPGHGPLIGGPNQNPGAQPNQPPYPPQNPYTGAPSYGPPNNGAGSNPVQPPPMPDFGNGVQPPPPPPAIPGAGSANVSG